MRDLVVVDGVNTAAGAAGRLCDPGQRDTGSGRGRRHGRAAYTPLPGITPDNIGPSHALVNARVGVTTSDKKVGIYLNADNLFDKVYYVGGNAGAFGNLLNYGQRRLLLAEIDVHL